MSQISGVDLNKLQKVGVVFGLLGLLLSFYALIKQTPVISKK